MTIDSAFEMGFDHIALRAGAGKPTVIPMKNGLAHGVRQASDFLMALQLTGAAKSNSVANLQPRMPVVVIGGGLTAVDTATESMAYYVVQVEKFLERYELLVEGNQRSRRPRQLERRRSRGCRRVHPNTHARFGMNAGRSSRRPHSEFRAAHQWPRAASRSRIAGA